MKGVSSIPPLFDEALHQSSTCGPFQKKANDRLKACFPDISPSLKNEKVVPLHPLIGASPTSIRGWGLQRKKMTLDSWFKRKWCFQSKNKDEKEDVRCSDAKMTKRGIRIAYRSETVERKVKMGRVRPLLSTSCTLVKTHVHKQDPAYASPSPRTQSLTNRPAYIRIELRMHKSKLPTQARALAHKSTNRKTPSTFSSIYHPKSILIMFLPLLMCQIFI